MSNENERLRIGQRIAELRKAREWTDGHGIKRKGMTQTELADRCGIAQSHIARIENGRYDVHLETLAAIAEGLGTKLDFVKNG